jgi:hypothetical protein
MPPAEVARAPPSVALRSGRQLAAQGAHALADEVETPPVAGEEALRIAPTPAGDDVDAHLRSVVGHVDEDLGPGRVTSRVGERLLHDPPDRMVHRDRHVVADPVRHRHPQTRPPRGIRQPRHGHAPGGAVLAVAVAKHGDHLPQGIVGVEARVAHRRQGGPVHHRVIAPERRLAADGHGRDVAGDEIVEFARHALPFAVHRLGAIPLGERCGILRRSAVQGDQLARLLPRGRVPVDHAAQGAPLDGDHEHGAAVSGTRVGCAGRDRDDRSARDEDAAPGRGVGSHHDDVQDVEHDQERHDPADGDEIDGEQPQREGERRARRAVLRDDEDGCRHRRRESPPRSRVDIDDLEDVPQPAEPDGGGDDRRERV